jgi:hypothetical protein
MALIVNPPKPNGDGTTSIKITSTVTPSTLTRRTIKPSVSDQNKQE